MISSWKSTWARQVWPGEIALKPYSLSFKESFTYYSSFYTI